MTRAASIPSNETGISVTIVLAALVVAGPFILLSSEQPGLALALLVGIGIVAVTALRTDIALLLLVMVGPLEGAFVSTHAQLSPTKAAGFLCFASFAIAVMRGHRIRFDRSHVVVLLLFAVAALSTLMAEGIDKAIVVTSRYGSFVALYIVITQFIGDHRMLARLAWTLSGATSFAALIAIQGFLAPTNDVRATLPGADANDVGFMFVTTLPLTFWLLRTPWPRKLLPAAMIGVIGAATLLTFSRGAVVGAGVGLVWAAVTERRRIAAVVPVAIVTAVVLVMLIRSDEHRFDNALSAKENIAQANVNSRLDAWETAVDMTAAQPLLGVGPGNFALRYPDFNDSPAGAEVGVVHNAYLDVAAELGVTGLVLFLAFLAMSFARASRARRDHRGPPGYATAVRTALLIAMASSITLSEQFYAPFWVLGGLATLLWLDSPGSGGGSSSPPSDAAAGGGHTTLALHH